MISFCSRVEGRTWASCELFRYASEDELDRRKSVGRSRSRKKIEKENFTDVSDAIAAFHLVFLFFFFRRKNCGTDSAKRPEKPVRQYGGCGTLFESLLICDPADFLLRHGRGVSCDDDDGGGGGDDDPGERKGDSTTKVKHLTSS